MRSRGPSIFAAARAAPSDSFHSGPRDHLGREQAAPPTRDQRPRATPYTAGDGASGEGATSPERRPCTRPERGLRPPHSRQWFRPDLATPRGGASSFRPDFTLRSSRAGAGLPVLRDACGWDPTDSGEVGTEASFLSPPKGPRVSEHDVRPSLPSGEGWPQVSHPIHPARGGHCQRGRCQGQDRAVSSLGLSRL